jgi:hypothetical protein
MSNLNTSFSSEAELQYERTVILHLQSQADYQEDQEIER